MLYLIKYSAELIKCSVCYDSEACAALLFLERSTNAGVLRSVMKKQNSDQVCSSNRKSMKFMRVTTG